MRKKLLLSLILAVLLLILPGQISYATPNPPSMLVNESTRECYIGILGDECFSCAASQGWKILNNNGSYSGGTLSCPAGFTKIDRPPVLNCYYSKSSFCCGGSSSHGDCADLVVNATQQACAFVSDINACIFLPKGWSPRPTDVPESIWSCNYKYHWVDNVSCLTGPPTPAPLFVDNAPDQGSDWILMIGLGLILLGGVLFWLMRRRVKP